MKHGLFEINKKGQDYFVGDLHGCYDQLMYALDEISFDREVDRLFSVGDLIDRGEKNEECLNLLLEPWFHAVKGNHEDMMLGGQPYHVWMHNGGQWANAIPTEDLDFYRALVTRYMYDRMTVFTLYGKVGVIHADIFGDFNKKTDDNDWTGEPAGLWGRTRIKAKNKTPVEGVDVVVVGHTPTIKPITLGNVLYIDTGACFGEGYLTVLNLEEVFKCIQE